MIALLPLLRATIEATAISATANVTSQLISHYRLGQPLTVNMGETLRFCTVVGALNPLLYLWHIFLERTFPAHPVPPPVSLDDMPDWHQLSERRPPTRQFRVLVRDMALRTSWLFPTPCSERPSSGVISRFIDRVRRFWRRPQRWRYVTFAGVNVKNTLAKLLVDVFLVGSWWYTILFLALMGALQGLNLSELIHSIMHDTVPIVLDGFKVWPMACLLGFVFVPVERRIVFFSVVGFGWFVYMSLAVARSAGPGRT